MGVSGFRSCEKEIAPRLIETGKLSLEDCSDLSLEEVQKLADEELSWYKPVTMK